VAGSDSGGGAGIQADLKTMNALGVHGCSVITALTAQNTLEVKAAEAVSATMIEAQFDALWEDLAPDAVKTGMLMNAQIVEIVARHIKRKPTVLVCDPVLVSTTGHALLDEDGARAMSELMAPQADILTPNLPEAEKLAGMRIASAADAETAALRLLEMGAGSVLLKGGHRDAASCRDLWMSREGKTWLSSPRRDTRNTHGTGCTLSAAIASAIALGRDALDAVILGKAYINQGLRLAGQVGHGCGPLCHGPMPTEPEDQPECQ
jgi:hydroxymethylpyrimidine kinase/phosphomethylpyrimidine kinase